ncbi:MAG TPA: hypothetical protein DDY78_16030 [Planctomycetales bacterium]|jgi:hypothetical protein|nr:hypothetical protein [Planctomycetales bacterium]
MSQLKFLLDEDTSRALLKALRSSKPAPDVLRVGELGAPPRGTKDPQVLLAAEAAGRCLISRDRKSMKRHLRDHFAAGRHTCGVVLTKGRFGLRRYVNDILLIWQVMTTDEWVDRTDYIPY